VRADALALAFEDAAFDFVCGQFGAMFFPDRISATAKQGEPSGKLEVATDYITFAIARRHGRN
jgi:hypothetical protein